MTEDAEVASLRQRLLISAALTLPVFVLAMVPPWQFDNWQWLSLTLAAPVVVWGAWPFHRAAWLNARHGAATMDTLISVGVLAAFGWSLYALFFGGAGMTGMTMTFTLLPERGSGADEIYLEVAAAVTVFILAGRYFEARAKKRSGAALARAARHGRQRRCGATGRRRAADPRRSAAASGTCSWSGPGRRSPPTAMSSRAPPRSTPACSPANRSRSRLARATASSAPP